MERHCRMKHEFHAVGVLPDGNPFLFFFSAFLLFSFFSRAIFTKEILCHNLALCAERRIRGAHRNAYKGIF